MGNKRKLVRSKDNDQWVYKVKQHNKNLRTGFVQEEQIGIAEIPPYTSFRRQTDIGKFASKVFEKSESVTFNYNKLDQDEEYKVDLERQIHKRREQREWDWK